MTRSIPFNNLIIELQQGDIIFDTTLNALTSA